MAEDKLKASSGKVVIKNNSAWQTSTLGRFLNSKISITFSAAFKSFLLWAILFLLFAFLIVISAQETFKDFLIPLGLYHNRTGALVDCSKPGNSRSRYCGGDPASNRQRLSESGAGFNLFD